MAIVHVDFYSEALKMNTGAQVLLPDHAVIGEQVKTLYLLHGMSDDEHAWLNLTTLLNQVGNYPLIVVMPRAALSYYSDEYHGTAYWQFLTQELPQKMATWFSTRNAPELTYVAGNSMGGYGALKWILNNPHQFKACFALSARTNLLESWRKDKLRDNFYQGIFGSQERLQNSLSDLPALVKHWPEGTDKPQIYQICGKQDAFYQENIQFSTLLKQNSFPQKLFASDGQHNWSFWNRAIGKILELIFENNHFSNQG